MMKCILAAGVALAAVQAALAEPYGDFASPKGATRENTGPLFWLHGDETEARLREYVGRVDESGQGILTIESRPHIDWMRAGWWRDVDIVLDENNNQPVHVSPRDIQGVYQHRHRCRRANRKCSRRLTHCFACCL